MADAQHDQIGPAGPVADRAGDGPALHSEVAADPVAASSPAKGCRQRFCAPPRGLALAGEHVQAVQARLFAPGNDESPGPAPARRSRRPPWGTRMSLKRKRAMRSETASSRQSPGGGPGEGRGRQGVAQPVAHAGQHLARLAAIAVDNTLRRQIGGDFPAQFCGDLCLVAHDPDIEIGLGAPGEVAQDRRGGGLPRRQAGRWRRTSWRLPRRRQRRSLFLAPQPLLMLLDLLAQHAILPRRSDGEVRAGAQLVELGVFEKGRVLCLADQLVLVGARAQRNPALDDGDVGGMWVASRLRATETRWLPSSTK
jgi:hypothetical protein